MKNSLLFCSITIVFSILMGCSVADDVKDTLDAVECANLIAQLNDDVDANEDCATIIADLDRVLSGSCNEFINAEQREQLEIIRTNCQDN